MLLVVWMVFEVFKKIRNKLNKFEYYHYGLISFIVIKLSQKRIDKEKGKINKKIIDFIKYK